MIQPFLYWLKLNESVYCEVHLRETHGLLYTLEWVHDVNLSPI